MKNLCKATVLTFLAFILPSGLKAQDIANVQTLEIKSKILSQDRPIIVYTPVLYDERDLMHYDVIYVFDAQNRELFDMVHAAMSFTNASKKCIVVGICSPPYPEQEYYRNDDYVPKPLNVEKYTLTKKPNAENFWKYVTDEVMPFIDEKFRTTATKYTVGHSLSASFVLDKAINAPSVFKGCLAISPNMAYDDYRLANDFIRADFNKPDGKTFLYISQGDEPESMPEPWGIGYKKVKTFIDSKDDFGKYTLLVKEFPEENHWNTFAPSLLFGLKKLSAFIESNLTKPQGEFMPVTFRVTVPDKNDDAYVVGNQDALGNWDPAKVKLKKVSDFEREVTLNVQFPLEFKITRGSWDSQAATNQNDGDNIVIAKPGKSKTIKLKVEAWFDK